MGFVFSRPKLAGLNFNTFFTALHMRPHCGDDAHQPQETQLIKFTVKSLNACMQQEIFSESVKIDNNKW